MPKMVKLIAPSGTTNATSGPSVIGSTTLPLARTTAEISIGIR